MLGKIRAILFDLFGTLVLAENPVTEPEISEYLFDRGYEVSPQQLRSAWSFVAFIDYPKYGYRSWRTYFSRIFQRLRVIVDIGTLNSIVALLGSRPYRLYPDAAEAVVRAKSLGFKTAIVTTIAHFQFERAIEPIKDYLDFIMTGYEAGCDKSNPRMFKRLLQVLAVKPDEAVVIGDSLELDVLLPRRLGINAIFLNRKSGNEGELVDAFVYDLNEAMETVIRKCGKNV